MKNQIIIHAAGKQTRIALLENGELAQLFIESPENQRTVGDIYIAEVRKVMGGIRAAFIDMNTPKDAFLHFSDLGEHLDDYLIMLNGEKAVDKNALARLQEFRKNKDTSNTSKNGTTAEEQNLLGNLLKPGHKVLVQIVKEPIGSKGPRVSTNISIAGRFLVLIPMGDYVAVSKRIKSYKERRVLRQTVADILPEGFGVIVRTVAEGQDPKMIHDDLMEVLEKWNNIAKDMNTAKPPTLLHRDLEMTESLVRDLFAKDFERILVDDPKMYKTLRSYVSKIAPSLLPNIELYKGSEHVFDHMKVMQDVESVFSPRVKLQSGGYLIFEQTEAMYVVDVNSGRYAAKKAQEDNSLKTNLESAREIAKQLRLRDIGGIIVVDFIDLRDDVNRKKVYDELKKEFRKDRAKTNVLPMSDFGLIQITRQRIRPSVVNSVSRVCPMCGGSGSIVSQNTMLSDIESWLQKFKHTTSYRATDLHINPYMKGMLSKGWISQHFKWMMKYRLRIGLIEDATLSMNDYKFTLANSDVDITETIVMDQSIDAAIKVAEQRIAELESELKRDSTTLDIYKKEKPETKKFPMPVKSEERKTAQPAAKSAEQKDNRKQDDRKAQTPSRQTETKAPSDQDNRRDDAQKDSRNDNRRNQKISKYYKKSDEDTADEVVEEKQAPKAAPKPVEKAKQQTQEPKPTPADKPVEKPTSETDTDIPEDLAHLRSAWEVAKEYKLKRERELLGNNAPSIKAEVASKDSSEPKEVVENVEESKETAKKAKPAAKKAPVKKATAKKSDESVKAASQIVQALVSSSKLKEDESDKDSKAKPAKTKAAAKTTKPAAKKSTAKSSKTTAKKPSTKNADDTKAVDKDNDSKTKDTE
jgi:ribonuclease G